MVRKKGLGKVILPIAGLLVAASLASPPACAQSSEFDNLDNSDDFHVAAEYPPSPYQDGWQVRPRLGSLGVNVSTILMPGEIEERTRTQRLRDGLEIA